MFFAFSLQESFKEFAIIYTKLFWLLNRLHRIIIMQVGGENYASGYILTMFINILILITTVLLTYTHVYA